MHFPGKGFEHIRCAEGYTEHPRIDGPRGHSAGYGHHIESHGEKIEDFKNGVTRQEAEDLMKDVKQILQSFKNGWGCQVWNRLPENCQIALVSLAYNAGAKNTRYAVTSYIKAGI